MDDWTGLSWQDLHLVDTARVYIDFMKQNGYTHALAPYWYATVMMELTDAELTVAPLNLGEWDGSTVLTVYPWGTSRTAFAAENLPPKLVVFVSESDRARFEQAFPQLSPIFEYWYTRAYEITPDDLWH